MFPFKLRTVQDQKMRRDGVSTFIDAKNSGTTNEFALQTIGARVLHKYATAATATFLPAKLGTRYRILGWAMSAANVAAGTSTGETLACTVDGTAVVFGGVNLAASAANSNSNSCTGLHILTDQNTAVALADLTAAPSALHAVLFYQEILESIGA